MVYSIPQPEMLNITSKKDSQDTAVRILSYSLEAWVIVISCFDRANNLVQVFHMLTLALYIKIFFQL